MKRTVVIAAAGSGRRFGSELPKCLIKVCGHHIFEYLLKAYKDFDEIRMVIGYKADMVAKTVLSVREDIILIENKEFDRSTGPLQSFYLGCKGLTGNVLFSVGDVMYSKHSAGILFNECVEKNEFVTISSNISENPIYAEVENGTHVTRLNREIDSGFEFAGSAFVNCSMIDDRNSFFFEQLNNYMPFKIVQVERLEVDTNNDLAVAEKEVTKHPMKYDYWR